MTNEQRLHQNAINDREAHAQRLEHMRDKLQTTVVDEGLDFDDNRMARDLDTLNYALAALRRDQGAERTLASIVAMLGWENMPPRETLEREIATLKELARRDQGAILALQRDAREHKAFVEAGCPPSPPSALAELEGLRMAQQAVVSACVACDGQGFVVGVEEYGVAEHGCDGSEEMCARTCPVEVPAQRQIQEQCEYCGRPAAAIQALINERLRSQPSGSPQPSKETV